MSVYWIDNNTARTGTHGIADVGSNDITRNSQDDNACISGANTVANDTAGTSTDNFACTGVKDASAASACQRRRDTALLLWACPDTRR
jgi:hypothetical protein